MLLGKCTSTNLPNNHEICQAQASTVSASSLWQRCSCALGWTKPSPRVPVALPGVLLSRSSKNISMEMRVRGFSLFFLFSFWLILMWCVVLLLMLLNGWLGVLGSHIEVYTLTGILCFRFVINPVWPSHMPTRGLFLYPSPHLCGIYFSAPHPIFCSHSACGNQLQSWELQQRLPADGVFSRTLCCHLEVCYGLDREENKIDVVNASLWISIWDLPHFNVISVQET